MKFGVTVPSAILAICSVEAAGSTGAVVCFKYFMQYKCHVWLSGGLVLSIGLPRRTEVLCDITSLMRLLDRAQDREIPTVARLVTLEKGWQR
jgi:hypothetical protein